MMKRNRSNETTQLLAGIFAVSALVCVALLAAIAAVLVLPFAMLALSGYLLCWAVCSAVTAGRTGQSARAASELGQAVLDDVAWTVAGAEHGLSRLAYWTATPVSGLFGRLWFTALDYLAGPETAPDLAGVGCDYPADGSGGEYPAGIERGEDALPSVDVEPERTEAKVAVEQELTCTFPSVQQDAELAPVVALPVAIPISEAELPVADLAPVLLLTYTPDPEPEPKEKRKARQGTQKPKAKAVTALSAARVTGETLYRKAGRRYVAVEGKRPEGETLYRRVSQGKRNRYVAA